MSTAASPADAATPASATMRVTSAPPPRASLRCPAVLLQSDLTIVETNAVYQRHFASSGTDPIGRRCYKISHGYIVLLETCTQRGA